MKIQVDSKAFYERAEDALDYIKEGTNALERVLLAHDWIIRECNYDYESSLSGDVPADSYSAFGCLINGKAVCNGYALAYSYLLGELGYETYILSSDSMNHAWNYVSIDGQWMHVDVTWDDPVFTKGETGLGYLNNDYFDEGFVSHKYFLKNDREIQELSHENWYDKANGESVPSSETEGRYEDAVFRDKFLSAFNLLEGAFYYCDDHGRLWASDDLWGTGERMIRTVAEEVYYPHTDGKRVFYTDAKKVFAYSPDNGETTVVEDDGLTITEIVVQNNALVYVTIDGETSERHFMELHSWKTFSITSTADTGGAISPAGEKIVPEGENITYFIVPDDGYEIQDVFIDDISIGAVSSYTFESLNTSHAIHAVFRKKVIQTFSDVPVSYAFFNQINWASENGIVTGYSDGTFKPQGECKRKQVVAFLWRLQGKPEPKSTAARFKDVSTKTDFYKAIYWASEQKVVLGFGDGTFKPDDTCTRGQVVAFLWRMAGRSAPKSTNSRFTDVAKGHTFYSAILWASEKGIVQGYNDGTFRPDQTCTRGQIVAFIYRYANLK